mmetsp:Transcript_35960/g.81180  ORF Transcript_35960/g.81180 Transcript_35960/m.81180 type:complete len:219 (+) Transcript_35960:56-712(+)
MPKLVYIGDDMSCPPCPVQPLSPSATCCFEPPLLRAWSLVVLSTLHHVVAAFTSSDLLRATFETGCDIRRPPAAATPSIDMGLPLGVVARAMCTSRPSKAGRCRTPFPRDGPGCVGRPMTTCATPELPEVELLVGLCMGRFHTSVPKCCLDGITAGLWGLPSEVTGLRSKFPRGLGRFSSLSQSLHEVLPFGVSAIRTPRRQLACRFDGVHAPRESQP